MWIEIRRIDNRTEPKFVLKWFADFFILSCVWVDPTGTSSSRPAKALGPTRPVGPSHARGAQHTKLIHGAQWWINCVGLDRTGFVVFNWQTSIYCSLRSLFFFLHSGQVKTVAVRAGQACRQSTGWRRRLEARSQSAATSGPCEAVANGSTEHAHSNTCKW